ncbi:MAG: DUF4149 domain-containing protein [Bryobacterales bacterium]|nr:DUF4149 domain-containing protein [Bryobacterales bacterium]
MHVRRLTMLIAGVWLGLTLAMLFVATENFRGVDRLLESSVKEATSAFQKMPPGLPRQLLRYQVSELNRYFFDWYGIAQMWLGVILLLNLLFATNGNKVALGLAGTLLAIVALERLLLFPEVTYLGRLLDFAPAGESPVRSRFWTFHKYFSAAEVVKLLLLLVLCGKMLIRREVRRRTTGGIGEAAESR